VGSNKFWAVTTDWLIEEGVAGAEQFREPRWLDQAFLMTDEAKQLFSRIFTPFARSLSKSELHAKGRERRIPLAPICDARDISQSPQREYRGYFVDIADARGTRLRMPGAPYKLSETPWALRKRAPQLGEHTQDILAWAGYSREQQQALAQQGAVR
jgi:benzylsuccinate CoA-transferase BbsE subunit